MPESAQSYAEYLAALPPERRAAVERVWETIRQAMPAGYAEEIGPKFLSFKAADDWYVSLANQKNYISLYLIPVYVYPELKARLDASGKRLKLGKSCINFKAADELPLDTIAQIVQATDADAFVAEVRRIREESKQQRREARA